MGAGETLHAAAEPAWSAAHDGSPGGNERDLLHCDNRLPWGQLPKDFPPCSTIQRYFYDWRDSGLLQTIRFALAMETRELEGREARPSAGVIDSQSVKTTESGGTSGFDAGKKVKGRKRHIITDTLGLLFGLVVHAADIQDMRRISI